MARPAPPPLSDAHLAPGLYVTATPIGNLRDVTLRALDVLAGCDLTLAEDTRVTAKLLTAYGLSKPMQRFDEHAVAKALPKLLERLAAGERIALCSDAGTPLVSDPGARLVTAALAQGSAVYPLPGASAVLAALVAAGLPSERFLFAGFPPPKGAARDHLGVGAADLERPAVTIVRAARACIPQYNVGHAARVRRAEEGVRAAFGGRVALCGNSLNGVGVADTIAGALAAGCEVSKLL